MNFVKWKPFLGENYNTSKTKLLLVGESHYLDDKPDSEVSSDDPSFTQKVVESLAINNDSYPSSFFPNVNRLFQLNDSNRRSFWSNVAFFNLIQKPMKSKKDRPSKEDFLNGWKAFHQVASNLKPEICLFLGNSVSKSMKEGLASIHGVGFDKVEWMNKVGRFWFYKADITINGHKVTCLFIKHPSAHFSHENWRKELSNKYSSIFSI